MLYQTVFLFIALFLGTSAAVPDPRKEALSVLDNLDVIVEKQLTEIELKFARENKLYFIFAVKEGKILLKAKGMVLREWEVQTARSWGNPLPLKPLPLIKKSTLFPPKRGNIKPAKDEEKDTFRLDTLEVGDMPSNYTLYIEGGIRIYIRSKPRNFFSTFFDMGRFFKWQTIPPLLTVWYSLGKKSFTAFDMTLDRDEAKSLYWTLTEGTACVILPPRKFLMLPDLENLIKAG